MRDLQSARDLLLGIGLEFTGKLVPRQTGKNIIVDLPHDEFVPHCQQNGTIEFKERDRYALAVRAKDRLVLWGGYHRTYAVLRHDGSDAAGVAPLVTTMLGIPEVEAFLAGRSLPGLLAKVLGNRPALLGDFLNDDLCIDVRLRKKRYVGRIEQLRPGKARVRIEKVNAES